MNGGGGGVVGCGSQSFGELLDRLLPPMNDVGGGCDCGGGGGY